MKTITIVSSKDQKKYVIETEASTMAELTAAMTEAGIEYEGMTLYEGLTKAEYDPTKEEAILPHDVPYKGTITNDLVFMLTAPQKKIKSGAMSYAEMKTYIKDNGLVSQFADTYGKNYTQGKTSEFIEFLGNIKPAIKKEEQKETPVKAENAEPNLHRAFMCLLDILVNEDLIDYEDQKEVLDALGFKENTAEPEKKNTPKSPYSDDELSDIFA